MRNGRVSGYIPHHPDNPPCLPEWTWWQLAFYQHLSQFLVWLLPKLMNGQISHQMALEKSAVEFDKFRETQKQIQHEESLKELEQDIQRINPPGKSGADDEKRP